MKVKLQGAPFDYELDDSQLIRYEPHPWNLGGFKVYFSGQFLAPDDFIESVYIDCFNTQEELEAIFHNKEFKDKFNEVLS